MTEYLKFRKMITPAFIQVIFWVLVAAVVIAGIAALANGEAGGLLLIFLGPLGIRIYAEILMVIFRINDNLADIRRVQVGDTGTLTASGTAQPPL